MASLIPGYEYDIFISYRQKDNKYDGWVTEFVDNLKKELEATFKEEISVYFDINPSDYLLETYDVDASVKDKLKCLVFIPIISRTYCDPKSFAWEYEFKAFIEQASQDHFGLKVKLPNGNVANRVLPARIHDLDNEDIKLCESVLGGVFRGIEFIYKEPGVNRSLLPKDNEEKNLNNTNYRNQINKVALAIKEIISGLKTEPVQLGKEKIQQREPLEEVKKEENKEVQEKPAKSNKIKLISGIAVLAVLIIAALLAYPKIFKRNTLEKLRSSGDRISVAVMPFQNMTNDTIWNVWQSGIQNEIINSLTNTEELKVRQTESINSLLQSKGFTTYASITPSLASTISQKLNANIFVYGSIKQTSTTIRVNAQLIDSKTEEPFKSFQIDGQAENILHIIDSLSAMINNFLIISKLKKDATFYYRNTSSTDSPEAFRLYIYGQEAFSKKDFPTAVKLLSQAIAIDSNFYSAMNQLVFAYGNQGLIDQAKKWILKSYGKRDQMPMRQKLSANWAYSLFFETPYEAIKYLRQILDIDDQAAGTYLNLGNVYNRLYQYDKAIPEYEKALEIFNKWDSKPRWVLNYTFLGEAYHKTGQYKKEKKLYKKAELDFPDDPDLIARQTILSLTEEDTVAANRYINQYISIRKEQSWTEAQVADYLGYIYSEAGFLEKAEEYYRKALSLEPKNLERLINLAYFLIDKDRDVSKGMELNDKAFEISPGDYAILDNKGLGLYKQGKYREALEFLNKSWELKPTSYDHDIYLHLQAAKKAVARQN